MPQRNLVIIMLSAIVSLACYLKAEKNRDAVVIAEAMHTIEENYFEKIDRRTLFEGAMQGMVRKLDEHSAYFPPRQYRSLREQLDQEFGGVGIVVELNKETNRLTVLSPVVDTPAYKAGMQAGDVILAIDSNDTAGMTLDQAVELMRGKRGEPISLTVKHVGEDDPVTFDMKRDIIRNPSVAGDRRREDGSWDFMLEEHPKIAHIRLKTFGEFTTDEVRDAIDFGDRRVDGLILDVRGNAGGYLKTAIDICNLFVGDGVIVSTRGRGGKMKREYMANSDIKFDSQTPIVVLTDRFSASASEIVAACLQDYGRAKVIGERTWGKGTVQNIIGMEGGKSALKLTTASYWRPSGKNIHRHKDATEKEDWGVRPDEGYELKLTDEQFKQLAKYRRDRDFVNLGGPENNQTDDATNDGGSGDGATDDDSPAIDPDIPKEEFKDPHVEKAVEYIESQIKSKRAKA